ncbi:MAG: cyanoexosortase A [Brasilonema octagenarum HA4186-MV1]|jgi:cyanoexosortase A|uniref:Cyanoexosortase A n=1 Tax=Brasilonema octagenarum UFV-OR1 TaxID=417115 RepID=A0ABX1M976_9CYAN|nr:cyanoexosortase A [Brasilonema octagenarum]MBW4626724.1 cyanoexosortase A [Brasilonema octagenarum HA4186-MV1]NMF64266.1 cyanoexosortase A [Brasilonema octagenarum UFV-OR1]
MKASQFTVSQLKYPQIWLLAIGAGLIAINLAVLWKANNSSLLGMTFLFWAAISSLVWEKRYSLNLESEIFSSFFGLTLIALLLIKSISLTSFGVFLYLSPVILAIGLALLASGFKGLKQYKAELFILFFLSLPKLLSSWLDISLLTAKFTTLILWYTGFEVARNGTLIYLPTGSVEVYSGCSGIELIFQLVGLALLFLLMFPQNLKYQILIPFVAGTLAFIVNALRVALMAILVAQGHMEVFDYWHEGDGSLVFSLIAVLLFGLFCWFHLGRSELRNKDATESSK